MSWNIRDLANDEHTLKVNAWNWHPTLLLLETMGILDKDRLERMQYNVVVTVSEAEARAIADQLENRVLPAMGLDDRLQMDLTLTDEPDDLTLHEDAVKNYSATQQWLSSFAGFCRTCGGFEIS